MAFSIQRLSISNPTLPKMSKCTLFVRVDREKNISSFVALSSLVCGMRVWIIVILCLLVALEGNAIRVGKKISTSVFILSETNTTSNSTCATQAESSDWGLVIVISIVLICLVIAFAIERFSFALLPESCVFLLVGIIVGALVRLSPITSDITNFNAQSFFNVLLPPIVLDNGYSMRKVSVYYGNRASHG